MTLESQLAGTPNRTDSEIAVVILCGGRGTRISGEYPRMPKPLVPLGGKPILWHIMKIYERFGHSEFVLALGWLGEEIKRYFLEYRSLTSDFILDWQSATPITYLRENEECKWRITCRDTGIDSLTGTRLRLAAESLECETVMVTYGDCVGDVNIAALLAHHRAAGKLATVTAVRPPSRFGELVIAEGNRVDDFAEKPQTSRGAINGGFMVFEREAIRRYIPSGEDVMLEREPLKRLAADGELNAYEHNGFWQPMDTPRERDLLEDLWKSGHAPWQVWC